MSRYFPPALHLDAWADGRYNRRRRGDRVPFNPVFIEKARKTVTDDTLRSDFKKDDRWKIARWLGGDDFTFWPENIIRLKKLCKAVDWPTDRTVFLDDDLLDDVAVLCIQLT